MSSSTSQWILSFPLVCILATASARGQEATPLAPSDQDTAVQTASGATGKALDSQSRVPCGGEGGAADSAAVPCPTAPGATATLPAFAGQQSVGALDGSGMVQLAPGSPSNYSVQLGTFGGYDSAVLDQPGLSSAFYGGQGAIAKLFDTSRAQFLLQDAVSVTDYNAGGQTIDALNRFSAVLNSHLNETWSLQASGFSSYGPDSLRTLAPAELQPVGSTGGISPATASYGLYSGVVLTLAGAMTLNHQTSAISSWSFSANESYIRYPDSTDMDQNSITGRLAYTRAKTRSLTYGYYGVAVHQGGFISCTNAGGGIDVDYRPTRALELTGSAGPVSGTGSCGQTFALLASGAASFRMTQNTVIYVSSDRRPNNGILNQSAWYTSVTAGMQHAFSKRIQAGGDYAYVYGSGYGSAPPANQSSQQNYVSGNLKFLLSGNFWEDVSVRHYTSLGYGAGPSRTIAVFNLWWSPKFGRGSGRGGSL